MPTPCYWLDDTGEAAVGLRRYATVGKEWGQTCESGYHRAVVDLGARVQRERVTSTTNEGRTFQHWAHAEHTYPVADDDPRWPTTCEECAYVFTEDDRRQVWCEEVYRRADSGEERTLHAQMDIGPKFAEAGAMWDAWWRSDVQQNAPSKPDNLTLTVRCPRLDGKPGGWDWGVDKPASSGGFWTRTGDPRNPPTLNVSPSIAIMSGHPGYYHGFLKAGVLTDHVG